jgi:hypothetical protein
MALDFPSSPTDGQIYDKFYWDNSANVWRNLSNTITYANISNTPTGSYTDGFDYSYVSFLTDGTLTVTRGGLCDILVVGGGGAGAYWYGGGGGAGGMLSVENAYLPVGSHDVTVGAGGIANWVAFKTVGNNGEASGLWKYFAPGGGGGGYDNSASVQNASPGLNGGSGGGGTEPGQAVGKGVPGLGHDGGPPDGANGSGGGGAGQPGNTAGYGYGGDGLASSITGSSVFYAGGGGGTGVITTGIGGGAGGGGNYGSVGTANTGGGGGASNGSTGGAGGSGIVIVRWRA